MGDRDFGDLETATQQHLACIGCDVCALQAEPPKFKSQAGLITVLDVLGTLTPALFPRDPEVSSSRNKKH